MDFAVDSNILVYLANPASPFHSLSLDAIDNLSQMGDELFVFPQNLIEFWGVSTRPISASGLGFDTG